MEFSKIHEVVEITLINAFYDIKGIPLILNRYLINDEENEFYERVYYTDEHKIILMVDNLPVYDSNPIRITISIGARLESERTAFNYISDEKELEKDEVKRFMEACFKTLISKGLTLEATSHEPECSEVCFDKDNSGTCCYYPSWSFWKNNNLEDINSDKHLLIRYDLTEDFEYGSTLILRLFFLEQMKGRYYSNIVRNITEEDLPSINEYLQIKWKYMKELWEEIS